MFPAPVSQRGANHIRHYVLRCLVGLAVTPIIHSCERALAKQIGSLDNLPEKLP